MGSGLSKLGFSVPASIFIFYWQSRNYRIYPRTIAGQGCRDIFHGIKLLWCQTTSDAQGTLKFGFYWTLSETVLKWPRELLCFFFGIWPTLVQSYTVVHRSKITPHHNFIPKLPTVVTPQVLSTDIEAGCQSCRRHGALDFIYTFNRRVTAGCPPPRRAYFVKYFGTFSIQWVRLRITIFLREVIPLSAGSVTRHTKTAKVTATKYDKAQAHNSP